MEYYDWGYIIDIWGLLSIDFNNLREGECIVLYMWSVLFGLILVI